MTAEQMTNLLPPMVDEDTTSTIAAMLKAAGDPLRLQILSVLASDSFGVLELCQIFDSKQSGMSHHLKVLARSELVNTRREGNTLFYRRSDVPLSAAQEQLRSAIYSAAETLNLHSAIENNLVALHKQRAETSRLFFRNNVEAFKKQQELISSFEVYGPEVTKLLDLNPPAKKQQALEIGPGIGEFLVELGKRFEQVIALDSSEPMLKQSRAHCYEHDIDNVEFVCGDTSQCQRWPNQFNCAVINMVLHHTPSPNQIFKDVAESLEQGGILLVCDLGAHDQDWVREACGDQWLGFNAEELENWAQNAHLTLNESRYLALRNGFQIQIHQFIKQ